MTDTRATGTPARQGTVRMSAHFVVSHLSGKSCRGRLCATGTMVKRVSVTHPITCLFDQHFLRLCTEETKTAPCPPPVSVGGFIVVVPILIQELCLAVNRHEVESQVPVSLGAENGVRKASMKAQRNRGHARSWPKVEQIIPFQQ